MENKQKLLDSPMNKLGLGGAFNSHFWNKRVSQSDVLTLSEFISLNPFLKGNKGKFICFRTPEIKREAYCRDFIKGSASFQKLKNFLLKNKFTHEDWILLLPDVKTSQGLVPDLSLLDKASLVNLSYHKVTGTKLHCQPSERIRDYLGYPSEKPILVKDILGLTHKQVKTPRYMERTFVNIQKKFKKYGLTEEDGPFMEIHFSSTKSQYDYVNELISDKGFTKKEAILAVDLGIRAGWISV